MLKAKLISLEYVGLFGIFSGLVESNKGIITPVDVSTIGIPLLSSTLGHRSYLFHQYYPYILVSHMELEFEDLIDQ